MKFRVELWRIAKFILITAVVDVLIACLSLTAMGWLEAMGVYTPKVQSALVGVTASTSAVVLVLLHRFFTFRARASLTMPLLGMFVAANLWTGYIARTVFESFGLTREEAPWLAVILAGLWLIISFLIQRYGFYAETTDTNDEKGD